MCSGENRRHFILNDIFWNRTDKIGAECVNGSPCVNSLALEFIVMDGNIGPQDKARHSCSHQVMKCNWQCEFSSVLFTALMR